MNSKHALTNLLKQPPVSLDELLAAITPEIYASLKQSIELQKWPDGSRLDATQIENAMQLIILFEHHYLPEELRTGRPLNQGCGNESAAAEQAIDVLDVGDVGSKSGVLDS